MDASNNSIYNNVNEENTDELPPLPPLDASRLIQLTPTMQSMWSPIMTTRTFARSTIPILSMFGQNPFITPRANDTSNNQAIINRLRQQLSSNIIYQPNALIEPYGDAMNNIVQQSFGEPANLYKRIISREGKEKIVFSLFNGETEEICAITRCPLEKGEEIATLPCKHIFNKEAIMTWLEQKSPECPICRYTLDEKEIKKDVEPPPLPPMPPLRGARTRLRNVLYDMLDRRLQEDEEERIQRAILLSLRESIEGDESINPD
jgi:hypothetical protein